MTNNMNKHFLIGFLKRAEQYGIAEADAIGLHEKYAGPVEDFKSMQSPGMQVTTPTPAAGTLSAGSAGLVGKPVMRRSNAVTPGTVSAGTAKATPGLRSGAEGAAAGFENLKNFLGFGK